ncbi:Polymer-forming cytoskeletal [Methyloligella halotolerans]|uniref:Polymer-forming cytoskeletal n=1 Tax=Methyloligella halotolerans TaxID=1177755 RepID=A0A1E2RY29_9HYPH|nr:polymer-forming cytoskeletal protein [Methyloligella halotolerans]ODA67133.1 Polymer-forming cytoskeletal [Methyloligella halotolerans]
MADNAFRPEDNGAYIGPGVTFKGEISGPEKIVVEGIVEGDITAGSLHIGPNGSVKGNVVATEADVEGTLSSNVEIKDFLLLRSTGRVEGQIRCGDFQVERGAVLAGDFAAGSGEGRKAKAEAGADAAKPAPKPADVPAAKSDDASAGAEAEPSAEEVRLEAAE